MFGEYLYISFQSKSLKELCIFCKDWDTKVQMMIMVITKVNITHLAIPFRQLSCCSGFSFFNFVRIIIHLLRFTMCVGSVVCEIVKLFLFKAVSKSSLGCKVPT